MYASPSVLDPLMFLRGVSRPLYGHRAQAPSGKKSGRQMKYCIGARWFSMGETFMVSDQTTKFPPKSFVIIHKRPWLSRISEMEWWNGILEWNTGMT